MAGKWFDSNNPANAAAIYGGPAVTNGIVTISGNCTTIMNNGDVGMLYSGGFVQNNAKLDVLGNISIIFNNGIVGNLLATEHSDTIAGKTGHNHIYGNSYIYINGGQIKGVVHPGHRHGESQYNLTPDQECIDGECYVILNGNNNYNCIFQGNYIHEEETSTPNCHIIFENYIGSLSGASIIGFKDIQFTKNCSVDLSNLTTLMNNTNEWTFDISHRNVSNGNIPMVITVEPSSPFDIKLIVNDQNTLADYKLYFDTDETAYESWNDQTLNITIYYKNTILFNNTVQATGESYDPYTMCEITGTNTIFDGYGLKLIRNNGDYIIFTQIN